MTRKEWERPDTQRQYARLWRMHLAAEIRSLETTYDSGGNVTLKVDGAQVNTPAELRLTLKRNGADEVPGARS